MHRNGSLCALVLGALIIGICLRSDVQAEELNYSQLERQCQGSRDAGCCMKSVRKMKEGKLAEPAGGKCPEGYKKTALDCSGSREFCEPEAAADISVTGNNMGRWDVKGAGSNRSK